MDHTEVTSGLSWKLLCQPVDAEGNVLTSHFPVDALPDIIIGDLRKEIHNHLPLSTVAHVSTSELNLWKLSRDISAATQKSIFREAIATLKFPDPHSDVDATEDVQELNPAMNVSTYWASAPEQQCVHIIVQVPRADDERSHEPPLKKARIDHRKVPRGSGSKHSSSGTRPTGARRLAVGEISRRYQIIFRLYEALWRQGEDAWTAISKVVVEDVPDPMSPDEKAEATLVDLAPLLSLTTTDTRFRLLTPQFIVRSEYTDLDRYVDDEQKVHHILLLGQSGIGKTTYLTYSLLRRLISGRPTLYASTPHNRYLFLDSGVYWVPDAYFDRSENPMLVDHGPDALVLFDLNEMQPTVEIFQDWRILASSSPHVSRYKGWVKHQDVEFYVMRPWSWAEVYLARNVATIQRTVDELYTAFIKYGGTARNLFKRSQAQIDIDINAAIGNCTNVWSLFPSWLGFQDETSSEIIAINPLIDEHCVLQRSYFQGQMATRYMLERLLEIKGPKLVDSMQESFRLLFRLNESPSASGILFEGAGHRYLFRSLTSPLDIRPLSPDEEWGSVNLQHAQRMAHPVPHDLRSFNKLNPYCYYRPLSTTDAGFDSFAIEINGAKEPTSVVLFKFTTSMDHPVNHSFLPILWNKDTLADAKVQWKLVFVVPSENAPTFQTQNWGSAAAENFCGPRVAQYVLGVEIEKLWDAVRVPMHQKGLSSVG